MTIPEKPEIFNGDLANLPAAFDELKKLRRWVGWRLEWNAVRDKYIKPPLRTNGGYASVSDSGTWSTHEEVEEVREAREFDGLGITLIRGDGKVGVDLDGVRDPTTGVFVDWVREILDYRETYAEVSPSGTGVRMFCEGEIEGAIVSEKMSVEVYVEGRYLTITGKKIDGCPDQILPAPKTLAALRARVAQGIPEHLKGYKSTGASAALPKENPHPWDRVKADALAAPEKWVHDLFGPGVKISGKGEYRVSSKMLGRQLQEDLVIDPNKGIKDFGIADQPGEEEHEGRMSAIDLVMKYSDPEKTNKQAVAWLRSKLYNGGGPGTSGPDDGPDPLNRSNDVMSLRDFIKRDLPPPDYISGRWLTTTSRTMLYAPTGIGKTMFAMGLAIAMASGKPFLHWKPTRPVRVLYIDGEMDRSDMVERAEDELRRAGVEIPDGMFIISWEDIIDDMPPLNTAEGQAFIEEKIKKIGGVDIVIFDNIISLLVGDPKDGEPWRATMPWVKSLTARKMAAFWIHHTGHDESHSYGDKTKEWGLNNVTKLERVRRDDTDVSFLLSFGDKARGRKPSNREEFADVRVALVDDAWTWSKPKGRQKKLSDTEKKYFAALSAACDRTINGHRGTSIEKWKAACVGTGMLEADDTYKQKKDKFSKQKTNLITKDWIACNEELAWIIGDQDQDDDKF